KGGLLAVSASRPNAQNPACAPGRIDFALVRPLPNRLAFFSGDRTHGVLDAYNRLPGKTGRVGLRLRVAVVINWWHRRPTQVPQFSETNIYRALAERRAASATTQSMHRRPRQGEIGTPRFERSRAIKFSPNALGRRDWVGAALLLVDRGVAGGNSTDCPVDCDRRRLSCSRTHRRRVALAAAPLAVDSNAAAARVGLAARV